MFSLTHEEIKLYVICLGLSLVFVLLSVIFFFIFSPKKTTPKYILFFSLLLGIFAGISAFLIEWLALNLFNFNFYSLKFGFSPEHWTDLIGPILFAFLFAALIEESIKFFILKKIINVSSVNQIIDGLKIGLIAGLGFALI
ncbi:PrsW family intramembrane metalloprotease, partial [Patescibacteria group bacterium]|nr:PrsW family intramembrane metalloprotease [Patescibacteria group bacterium]